MTKPPTVTAACCEDTRIWLRLTGSMGEPDLAEARALLSPDERARHDCFRQAHDRRDYAAAHALLRTSLSRCSDVAPQAWVFEGAAHHRPRLAVRDGVPVPFTFNISHARGLVACAVATGADVGIDVERSDIAFDCSPVASRYFCPEEIAQLEGCSRQERSRRFVELWTLKEAYVKATGRGASEAWDRFGFRLDGNRITFLPPLSVNAEAWRFALFAVGSHYRLAVAVAVRHDHASNVIVESGKGGCTRIAASADDARDVQRRRPWQRPMVGGDLAVRPVREPGPDTVL